MKKLLAIIATSLALLSNYTYATTPTARENTVCFNKVIIDLANSTTGSYTPGQPFDDNITFNENCITISAGREASEYPVTWLQNNLAQANPSIEWVQGNMTATTNGSTPELLNFALNLNMNITIGTNKYICNNLYLGQGSYKQFDRTVDNWWLFSNNNNQKHTITCLNSSSNEVELNVSAYNNTDNEFNITE